MRRNLIAILRGVRPDEVVEVAEVIVQAGIDAIEVPLNSPDPFKSVQLLVESFSDTVEVGAGTVLTVQDVDRLSDIGARLVVSPNCDTEIIRRTKQQGMISLPGVMTPSECFAALDAGADGLKFFPADVIGTNGIGAMRAVLPANSKLFAVGGVNSDNLVEWLSAGVSGFGIGSSLYQQGKSVSAIADSARAIVESYDAAVKTVELKSE